ncbi:septum formation initiator family protein [bacterium]|nr:septum formation initiator family protein [bacterium]
MRIQGYLAVFAVTLVLGTVVLGPRWVKLSEQRARVEALSAEVARIEGEIERLKRECQRLEEDPEWVERFARERMDWRRAGEVVFQ